MYVDLVVSTKLVFKLKYYIARGQDGTKTELLEGLKKKGTITTMANLEELH